MNLSDKIRSKATEYPSDGYLIATGEEGFQRGYYAGMQAAAELAKQAESVPLVVAILSRLDAVEQRLYVTGKGTYPNPDYVRDETWASWQHERSVLVSLLCAAGLDRTGAHVAMIREARYDTTLPKIVREQAEKIERLRTENATLMRRDYERHLDATDADPVNDKPAGQ